MEEQPLPSQKELKQDQINEAYKIMKAQQWTKNEVEKIGQMVEMHQNSSPELQAEWQKKVEAAKEQGVETCVKCQKQFPAFACPPPEEFVKILHPQMNANLIPLGIKKMQPLNKFCMKCCEQEIARVCLFTLKPNRKARTFSKIN